MQIGNGSPLSIRREWKKAQDHGHHGESSQRTSAVFASWWWWWMSLHADSCLGLPSTCLNPAMIITWISYCTAIQPQFKYAFWCYRLIRAKRNKNDRQNRQNWNIAEYNELAERLGESWRGFVDPPQTNTISNDANLKRFTRDLFHTF